MNTSDSDPLWKFNVMIAAMVVLALCGAGVVGIYAIDSQSRRAEIQPKDVLAGITQQISDVNVQLVDVRESINHAKELAAKNEAIVQSLKEEIADLKEELNKGK